MSNRTRKFLVLRSRSALAGSGLIVDAESGSESSFPQDAFSPPSPLSDSDDACRLGIAYLGLQRRLQAADSGNYTLGGVNQRSMKSSLISMSKASTLNKAMVEEMTGHTCGGAAESLLHPTYTTLSSFFHDIDQQLIFPDIAGDNIEDDGESIDLDAMLDPKWVEGSKAWRNALPVYRPRGLSHADIVQLDSQWDGDKEGTRDYRFSVRPNLTSRSKALTKVVSQFTGIEDQDKDENDDDDDGDDEHDSEKVCEEDDEGEEGEVDTRLPPDLAMAFPETKHPGIVFDHLLLDTPDVEPDEYDPAQGTPTLGVYIRAQNLDPAAAVANLAVIQSAMAEDLRRLSVAADAPAAAAAAEPPASVNTDTGPAPNRNLNTDTTSISTVSVTGSSALESVSTNVDMVGGLTAQEYYGAGLDMYVPQEEIEIQEVAYSLYESGVTSYIQDDNEEEEKDEDSIKDSDEEMEDQQESQGYNEDEDDGVWIFDQRTAQRAAGAVSTSAGRTYPNHTVTDQGVYSYPPSPTKGSAQSLLCLMSSGSTSDSVAGPGRFQCIPASETTGDTESWFDVPVDQYRGKGKERA
ncbi:hypothetical protein BDZ91DRAFT_710987 [Kalaharituber pfeilii]|nr:hypothetical protein BDZ91DRAFT_710987 [Kalaharituber pfeilii]